MHKILDSYHIVKPGQQDQISNYCNEKQNSQCYKHTSLSYRQAKKELMGHLHLKQINGQYSIRSVYCPKDYTQNDFPRGKAPGPGKVPHNFVLNTEHTWPQSLFTRRYPKNKQKSDLHILFPTNSKVNSLRGSYPFGEVQLIKKTPCENAKLGVSADLQRRIVFEPPNEHKGNVARAMFYYSIRYSKSIDSSQEYYLRKWHKQDPVDENEHIRNEKIFDLQGSRNPFIDYPALVESIKDF